MVVKKAWMAMATLLAFAALPACATSNVDPVTTSTSTGAGGGDTGGGGPGTGGQGGEGGKADVCGDGSIATTETCDDGNTVDGDGCDATCELETGWNCADAPTICTAKCGDGFLVGEEVCDDSNLDAKDGCDTTCKVEFGYLCDGSPSICATVCGDGLLAGAEECDDVNTATTDGCSDTCKVEKGWSCVSQPSKCTTGCGDGTLAGAEECDDHDFTNGDGCDDACKVEPYWTCDGAPSVCVTPCGDGQVTGTEVCDDSNTGNGDGCNDACKPEPGYTCTGVPSTCSTACGDGVLIAGVEICDDGNTTNGDGCNAVCKVEPGFTCAGTAPTACTTICGDGYAAGGETCDVGPPVADDGCDSTCHAEHGYICNNFPSVCSTVCGDGVVGGSEQCDDGNNVSGDGCSPTCGIIQGYMCAGEPSVCITACGDGIQAGQEQCDDSNNADGDCCSSTCAAETGCEVEPNDVIATANDFTALAISDTVKGTINPSSDLDVYLVTIPAGQKAFINAATLDGFDSSCLNLTQDSILTVYDINGVSLGTDDNTGPGNCAQLQVINLTEGDYYVEVKDKTATPFSYALSIQVQVVICGNSTKEPGEQCDDGNLIDGDGCNSTCVIEVLTEIEPNGTPAQALANGPFKVGQLWAGAITPAGDLDFYMINIPSTADLRIETFDGNGPGNCVACDTKAFLFASDGTTQLAVDDDGGVGACSLIDPATATGIGARHLAPGNYYIRVQHYSSAGTTAIPAYKVFTSYSAVCGNSLKEGSEQCDGGALCQADCLLFPACGDGVTSAGETCDDGNTSNGDGCTSTCAVQAGFTCNTATPSVCTAICGDGVILGAEACDDGNTNNTDGCSSTCAVQAGYMCGGAPSVCITVCGDGTRVGAEQCDDGNTLNSDGCSSSCGVESNFLCSGTPSVCIASESNCNDGVDNDGDGTADCADTECATACAVLTCPAGQSLYSFNGTDLPSPIPDPGTLTSSVVVSANGTVTQAVLKLDITHTYDSDVDITLKSPTVAAIDISSDNGSSNDNYTNTVFNDTCATAITAGTAPYTGCYKPESPLSAFAGQPANGTWTLSTIDDAGSDTGTLNSWSLALCVQ